jgi:hypothetical protein
MAAISGIDETRKAFLPPIFGNSKKQNAVANYDSPTIPIKVPTPQKDQTCHQNLEKTDYEM